MIQYFKLFFSLVFTFAICTIFSQQKLQQAVENFVAYEGFKNASISLRIQDAKTGEVLAEHQPKQSLAPASTVKLFSTAEALLSYSDDYQIKTEVYLDGSIEQGKLIGNVWIRGYGDMTLGSRYFETQANFLPLWTEKIKQLGITEITGAIIADGSVFGYEGAPDGWSWSDMGNYYGSHYGGLNAFDNTLYYRFKTGSTGTLASFLGTEPSYPGLVYQNYIRSAQVSGDNSYIYGSPYSPVRFGTGSLPNNKSSFEVKGSCPDPEILLAYSWVEDLKKSGITCGNGYLTVRQQELKAPDYQKMQLVYTHLSPKLIEIVTATNYRSINLFAEGLMGISALKSGTSSTSHSVDYMQNFWSTKISTSGLFLKDGSGLSRTNGVSASHYCELLNYLYQSEKSKSFYNSLPVSGVSGTLSNVCRGQAAHGKVHAKSGTMSRVKSYAGYIETNTGRTLSFAVIVNNFTCSTSSTVDQMERLFNVACTN